MANKGDVSEVPPPPFSCQLVVFGEKTKQGKLRGYQKWDQNVLWMESGTAGTNSVDR